jgi:subtilisin family serine protease
MLLVAGAAFVVVNVGVMQATTVTNLLNWGLERIDARRLPLSNEFPSVADGTGVNIYVIDTGVATSHRDFLNARGRSRIAYIGDFCTGVLRPAASSPRETYDDGYDGHGTHVAGFAAGLSSGVARNARIFSLRAQGPSRNGASLDGPACGDGANSAAVMAAINWVTQNGEKPAVVNLSFCCFASDVRDAIQASITAGFVYSLSAGTGGDVVAHWGSQLGGEALIVGGTRANDTPLATYSNGPTLFAPAQGLCGAGLGLGRASGCPTGYSIPERAEGNNAAGDSFAAPWVTGVAATLLQEDKGASPTQVRAAILTRAATVSGLPRKMLQMVRQAP